MDCGGTFVKYVLFLFNILFVVCGILLIVFGSLMISNLGDFNKFDGAVHTTSIPIAVIVLGCIIFVISFMGCCGAIREDTCLTMTYSVLMLVLLILQLILVIYIWVERTNFLNTMNTIVDKAWTQRNDEGHFMDVLQIAFKCCGKYGPIDYTVVKDPIPNSCCGPSATACSILSAAPNGCSKTFSEFWDKNINITRYAGIGVAAVELVAFIFACCLANQVRNERRRAAY